MHRTEPPPIGQVFTTAACELPTGPHGLQNQDFNLKKIQTDAESAKSGYVLAEHLKHYHHERIHQGLHKIIEPQHGGNPGEIICLERLGGLLKSYHRKAA